MGSIRRAIGVLVAASAVTLAAAAPANAGLLVASAENCQPQPASQVFLRWLDPLRYEEAPGGRAESATGWTLSGGARIVSGNEPWKVGGGSDAKSLQLPRGSRATTGVMCVGIGHPVMRFFARRTSGWLLDTLKVEVLFEGAGGQVQSLPVGVSPACCRSSRASRRRCSSGSRRSAAARGRSTTCSSIPGALGSAA